MRISLFLSLFYLLFGAFLWLTLSGASFFFGALIWLSFIVITIGYADTMTLFLLGAREVRSSDEPLFFESAAQEAYKLAVPMPHLYFYNGTLERGFVLQNRGVSSLVLNKSLIDSCSSDELSAICFELLLQVKKGMAVKRTKVMFFLGVQSWIGHALVNMFLVFIPFKEVKDATNWFLNYLLHPWLSFIFKLTLGRKYFHRLGILMKEFPQEEELFRKVGLKLTKVDQLYSLPSRKLIELFSYKKSRNYQNILALEFLPHEWDFLFSKEGINRAEKT